MISDGKLKFFGGTVAVILLLVFLSVFFQKGKIQSLVFDVAYIPEKVFFSISDTLSSGFGVIFSLKDIVSENSELRSENRDLQKKLIEFEGVKEQNVLLREQLALGGKSELDLLEAKIVSFEPSNLSEFLIINKGLKDGVEKEMSVISSGNILLGKIFNVYESYSEVMLITDKDNKVNVKSFIQDGENREVYSGVLSGYFGKSLFMDFIEKSFDAQKGDVIVTSGLDGVYPENLKVGEVDVVKDDDNAVFNQAYLDPAFLPLSSTLVFIIR